MDLSNLNSKVTAYHSVLENTTNYRKAWHAEKKKKVKPLLLDTLTKIVKSTISKMHHR